MNIFNEINENGNDYLSLLNKKDLYHLLYLINNYKLLLRDKINVDAEDTFGLEIECEYANRSEIAKKMPLFWELADDLSLECGAEIKSPPLRDTKESWITLRNVCTILKENSVIGYNAGGHVHVGLQALSYRDKALINFMKLWAIYEHIIYRFSYGEYIGARPGIKDAAKSVKIDFVNMCYLYEDAYASSAEILSYMMSDKCLGVNFKHYYTFGTLEFRCPNGSLNPVVWQNNVNLFVKMMEMAKSGDFSERLIEEQMKKVLLEEKSSENIYVKDATIFADLIFDNNLDKVYFLRQYLKSFEKGDYELCKSFS